MTVSRLKKIFLQELDSRFGRFGFARSSDKFYGDRYYRPMADGRQSVLLTRYLRETCLEVDAPQIGVRFDNVEELVAKFEEPHPLVTAKDIDARTTIGTRLKVFQNIRILRNEEDTVSAAEEFVPRVIAEASPFWEKFSSLAETLKVTLADFERVREFSVTDVILVKKAIAMAIILTGRVGAQEVAKTLLSRFKGENLGELEQWVEKTFL